MAAASLTLDGLASDPGSYLALPDKGLRRQSFTALETAAAALEALQSTIASAETAVPEKWRDSNPAERPARSRKTSLAVAAQLPAGLKLCSSCRKVRPGLHRLTDTRDYFRGRHCRDYLPAYKTTSNYVMIMPAPTAACVAAQQSARLRRSFCRNIAARVLYCLQKQLRLCHGSGCCILCSSGE